MIREIGYRRGFLFRGWGGHKLDFQVLRLVLHGIYLHAYFFGDFEWGTVTRDRIHDGDVEKWEGTCRFGALFGL